MSKSDRESAPKRRRPETRRDAQAHSLNSFDAWLPRVYANTDGFTALVVLLRIEELTLTPLRATYVHIVGDDLTWLQVSELLASAGDGWDGVLFAVVSDEDEGGPVADFRAKAELQDLTEALQRDRQVINKHHFFDRWGRRMKIEEVTTH